MKDRRKPLLIILTGVNGSGKTTFHAKYLSHLALPFLNADLLALNRWPSNPSAHAYDAAAEVARGGHDVPVEKIRKRFFLVQESLVRAIPLVEQLRVYDNSPLRICRHVLTVEYPRITKIHRDAIAPRPLLSDLVSLIEQKLQVGFPG